MQGVSDSGGSFWRRRGARQTGRRCCCHRTAFTLWPGDRNEGRMNAQSPSRQPVDRHPVWGLRRPVRFALLSRPLTAHSRIARLFSCSKVLVNVHGQGLISGKMLPAAVTWLCRYPREMDRFRGLCGAVKAAWTTSYEDSFGQVPPVAMQLRWAGAGASGIFFSGLREPDFAFFFIMRSP